MKCPTIKSAKGNTMEKSPLAEAAAAESKVLYAKDSPKKEPAPVISQDRPVGQMTVFFSTKNSISAVHNKENNSGREQDGALEEYFEDSGYLSLQNSHIDHHGDEEEDHIAETHQGKRLSASNSPSKCQQRTRISFPGSLAVSTPVDRHGRSTAALSSTPNHHHVTPNLPILRFQQAVCEELTKSYKKNRRYDFSVISKIAEKYPLDRVIGGQIGLENVDMFTSLLFRNMKGILTDILALLGDLDLISCKNVSKTWKKIICEDSAAARRCRQAEQALRESRNSQRNPASGLTRDVGASRVVLSCMQALASRRTASCQKSSMPSQCTRFDEFVQAASTLKRHESLRSCRRCGSPATYWAEAQRATCSRSSCLFDFCTRCQEPFHSSSPCRTVKPHFHSGPSKETPIIPGSARSKRNVKRL
ncbi:F-box only protein 5 [Poecilia latipinna]|uniref:F-box protein 5 n=1 Tax=Poecilia latipinna TaxID=48699 RepID=A0A3B3UDZ2_9TELE|nr:PREDICTED: F-box only protein 5-like [Poecilia latipinna]